MSGTPGQHHWDNPVHEFLELRPLNTSHSPMPLASHTCRAFAQLHPLSTPRICLPLILQHWLMCHLPEAPSPLHRVQLFVIFIYLPTDLSCPSCTSFLGTKDVCFSPSFSARHPAQSRQQNTDIPGTRAAAQGDRRTGVASEWGTGLGLLCTVLFSLVHVVRHVYKPQEAQYSTAHVNPGRAHGFRDNAMS